MEIIEKIRKEIERLYDGEAPAHDQQCEFEDGYFTGIATISKFLDSLQQEQQEQPDKSLEEEIETWIPAHISIRTDETLPINPTELAEICKEWGKCVARHFAEWQKSQTPMPEDTVLFNKGVAEGRRLEREDMLKDAIPFYKILKAVPFFERKNTRIIIVNEEE